MDMDRHISIMQIYEMKGLMGHSNIQHNLQNLLRSCTLAYLHQVRFQMRMVALVQTQVLMAIPVPNMENKLIFSTIRLGRFLIEHCGIGLLV